MLAETPILVYAQKAGRSLTMNKDKSFLEIVNDYLNSGETYLPIFNKTALRVQQEITNNDPNHDLIVEIISGDQTLTSEVLRKANSSFFRGLHHVRTIKEAITRIGIAEVAKLVLIITQKRQFQSKDKHINALMELLWRHSQQVAIGAKWIAVHCDFHQLSNHVFFAGLLHDVGKLLILTIISKIKTEGKIDFQPTEALISEVMSGQHTTQGYSLMESWNIPEIYCVVARDHHLESFEAGNFIMPIIRLADMVCNKMGYGLNIDPSIDLSSTPEAILLGLSEIDLVRLEIELEDTLYTYS
ncbi:MAG: HDOD domain-containing protein [Desulfobacteraceae bacterium]|nr:MAG: HDOD domain-containing protein [Desulfobacteraceae bacterium]